MAAEVVAKPIGLAAVALAAALTFGVGECGSSPAANGPLSAGNIGKHSGTRSPGALAGSGAPGR